MQRKKKGERTTQDEGKKHNTASTSRGSFAIINSNGQRALERQIVLNAIRENQPVTSRQLSVITSIERTNITRSLFDLIHDHPRLVKEVHLDHCPLTKRLVKWYALTEYTETQLTLTWTLP